MSNILIVVDMQNDFIDGSLGTPGAQAIVPNVKQKIFYKEKYNKIFFTMDTHGFDYLDTFEGKNLPVEHCIEYTQGWSLNNEIFNKEVVDSSMVKIIRKHTFGCDDWDYCLKDYIKDSENFTITIIGLYTDICVISNALILRTFYPNVEIVVDSRCCAGTTPEKHEAALQVMESCLIDVIR